ncbi:MAG: rhomboid family intramembrane serine protease [Planctomycetes bacterium]|nr:rhomboid family intramembrane serine protease [Planctomycetota bacterium]
MLLPIRSNCDLYHWPFATIGLIAANIAAAFHLDLGAGPLTHGWMLTFGQGLHPLQWVTHNFVHFGACHLIGNMIFLWAFGIGIEGRIGWWRFLTLYLVIGIAGGMIGQFFLADYQGFCVGAGGASLAIFGLLAVALLWHPFSELDCLWICCLWGRPVAVEVIEISVVWFAGLHILKEFFFAGWIYSAAGVGTTSAMFHSLGAVVGAGCGLTMLKLSLVDCEGQDAFNVTKESSYFDQFKRDDKLQPTPVREISFNHGKAAKQLRLLTQKEDWAGASSALNQMPPGTERTLNPQVLKALGNGLYLSGDYENAGTVYASLLDQDPEAGPIVSLKLAAILLEVSGRPKAALRVLSDLAGEILTEKQLTKSREIAQRAEQLIDSGNVDLLSSS